MDKRFIEESFPVKEVSIESAREKNIRHGHISTLHVWWARRPLAASRATNYAALIQYPKKIENWNKRRNLIIELCKWENSTNKSLLNKAKNDILKANNNIPPKILDPFGGGGAIPLEAFRLGCEVHSSDLNPVAILIQKCTIEYPNKYNKSKKKEKKWGDLSESDSINTLLEDLKKWGKWILIEAKKEINKFYSDDDNGLIPLAYIWARTVPCQNPTCNSEIPLIRQFWLENKKTRKIAFYLHVKNKKLNFKIVGTSYEPFPEGFNPKKGTISHAIVTCPICGSVIDGNTTRKLFQINKAGEKMIVVISHKPGKTGKSYRIATKKDLDIFHKAINYLHEKRTRLKNEWGIDPVPNEFIHTPNNVEYKPGNLYYNFTPVVLYGLTKWSDLFNARQKLALITFIEKLKKAHKLMLKKGYEVDYAKAIITYLALVISKLSTTSNNICRWNNGSFAGKPDQFGALEMKYDYPENNPFSGVTGSYLNCLNSILSVKNNFIENNNVIKISQSSAQSLKYPDNYFDAIFTDPPYYDNVPYATISDFFYIWLKRSLGDLYQNMFITSLTPKINEAIEDLSLLRGMKKEEARLIVNDIKTSEYFNKTMLQCFREFYRVLKPNGIAIIVYAHKSADGWETLINSLLDSGLIVTASWPLATERKGRQRAQESAALTSSIYIVARKIIKKRTTFYPEVKKQLKSYLNEKLERLWQEGISGADFFIAAIGAGIEVFGEYEKILDYEGNLIKADKFLEEIRKISTDFAVKQILNEAFTSKISSMTRFYVLWRWNYQEAKVHFDEARKLAQSIGINLELEWNKGFIRKEREFIRVIGPKDRKLKEFKESNELIDILHKVLLLWERGDKENILKTLEASGYGDDEIFYRVAQAISQTLPNESKEKKLLDGFLSGKEKIKEQIKISRPEKKLEEWMK